MEQALVYGVRPGGLLVFVPRYHLRGSIHLADRAGLVRPPLIGADVGGPAAEERDAFAIAGRRDLKLETGTDWLVARLICLASVGRAPAFGMWRVSGMTQGLLYPLKSLDLDGSGSTRAASGYLDEDQTPRKCPKVVQWMTVWLWRRKDVHMMVLGLR